jgi:hypothetical protein
MRGRPKGSLNKKTVLMAVEAKGEVPLDYMLRVMRDPTQDHARRDEMAKAAAQYVHPKLASTQVKSETTVRYVARVPEVSPTVEAWSKQHSPETKTLQ